MVLSVGAGDIFAERRGTGDSGVVGVGALGSRTTDENQFFGDGFLPEIPGLPLRKKTNTLDVPKQIASDQLKSMGFHTKKKTKLTQRKPTLDSSCGVIEVHRLELKFLNALQLLKSLKEATCCWHIHL